MPAPQVILDLIERFDRQIASYKSGHYNETQLRREFLDPLFKSLGWDIDNNAGYAEAYKDVIHEDAIKIGEATKAPDYCFRIGGTRKFFLEAKKPSVWIKNEPAPAFQLRRYAWSSKLPLSILSDFEEFAVYDCRIKPDQRDSASAARIQYFTFREYLEKWDEIASIFSRDAVLKGSFDRYAESTKGKRGTADVDDSFLQTIESWRSDLAKNLARNNPKLTQRELNFSVQRIIDRIIFLRICEGRGIEDYGRLQALVNGERVYPRLCELFQQADDRYNSGLFHFQPEKGRHEAPDELTLNLHLDDKLLKTILKSLYYPESPYVFSALPADILGQVYEQFLGKVIRLTEAHNAIVEEKPEVKKAGGVYYTPTYIVEYIVQNTVGKLISDILSACSSRREEALTKPPPARKKKSKDSSEPDLGLIDPNPAFGGARLQPSQDLQPTVSSPEQQITFAKSVLARVAKLRILDPACGSGSFLLGAYEYLLKWHLDFYVANSPEHWAKGKRPALVQVSGSGKGDWRLTINERKRILLANIYGVDIDSQAVETTKLSLLLKVLEGETEQSLQPFFRTFHERALPDLGDNIKCGNSLIGPDFYNQPEMNLLSEDERYQVNVFDWRAEFPDIFKDGGFDAVIGNPPYIRIQRVSHAESDYYFQKYEAPTSKMDVSLVFLEKGLKLLRQNGVAGFICTSQWLTVDYGSKLRNLLRAGFVSDIVDFGSLPVFVKASTYPGIFLLTKMPAAFLRVKRITERRDLSLRSITETPPKLVDFQTLTSSPWNLGGLDISVVLSRTQRPWKPLHQFGRAYIGCKTGMNEAFVMSRSNANDLKLEPNVVFPYAYRGEEIERYNVVLPDSLVIYPYSEGVGGTPELIPEELFRRMYPNAYEHLLSFKPKLRLRQDSRRLYAHGSEWYRHLRPGSFRYIRPAKLVFKAIAKISSGGLLGNDVAFDGANCPAILLENLENHQISYILGILNSKLASYYLRQVCPPKLAGYLKYSATCLSDTPIRVIEFSSKSERLHHDTIAGAVDQMIDLQKSVSVARTPQEKTSLGRQIAATDAQIDRVVYELYGLTPEEIAIVEGASKGAVVPVTNVGAEPAEETS
jgi:hypothetical protein